MTKTLLFKTADMLILVQQALVEETPSLRLTYTQSGLLYLTTKDDTLPFAVIPEGYDMEKNEEAAFSAMAVFGDAAFVVEIFLADHANLSIGRLELLLASQELTQTMITLDEENVPKITFSQSFDDFLAKNKESLFALAEETKVGASDPLFEDDNWDELFEKTSPKNTDEYPSQEAVKKAIHSLQIEGAVFPSESLRTWDQVSKQELSPQDIRNHVSDRVSALKVSNPEFFEKDGDET